MALLLRFLRVVSLGLPLLPLSLSGTASAADSGERPRSVGAFVTTEWRALAVAEHFSHGPGFAAGMTFARGRGRIGLTGFARPGPINPSTFSVKAADNQSYKGSETLTLRSDGAFVGLMGAWSVKCPGIPRLRLTFPVSVGQAVFGFYLSGDDRKTPDGRLVSDWENELMDGRDSSVALGLEGGLQLGLDLPPTPEVQPYLGLHYFYALGYDAYVRDSYAGPLLSLGFTFGNAL